MSLRMHFSLRRWRLEKKRSGLSAQWLAEPTKDRTRDEIHVAHLW